MSVRTFYDELAPRYHLVYEDWEASAARQGSALASLIAEHWPAARSVLDVAVGIGTQALGLAARGYTVVGSDLSPAAVRRAAAEASRRGLRLPCTAADFRALPARSASADVVLACDNALPHLESEFEIGHALAEWFRLARPGGGCLLSMRDYGTAPPPGTVDVHPYGERTWEGRRYAVRQVWTWQGPRHELTLEIAPADEGGAAATLATASYLAIPPARVEELMRTAGFVGVERLDGRFFQPVLIGSRPPAA